MPSSPSASALAPERIAARLGSRSIVLIGMPGAGKTSIGRRLAARLELPFVDADHEIEAAAGMAIPDIFEVHGEAAFRDGERRVIKRLLGQGPQILATGGGAFMAEDTRAAIAAMGISVWLKADHETLMERVRRRTNRPLLAGEDPEGVMRRLLEQREPVFALADLTVTSYNVAHDTIVASLLQALDGYLSHETPPPSTETPS
ncbi:shikimate kinase [Amorphus sp. 3PC139-8]|uniref:shikimate kinase n=1 Tax=Amorphus sp. 3PC139-8 TaxID=2735676 RepID=UPI00345DF837